MITNAACKIAYEWGPIDTNNLCANVDGGGKDSCQVILSFYRPMSWLPIEGIKSAVKFSYLKWHNFGKTKATP